MKRILVIDNEPYIQEAAQMCLETMAEWQVMTAGSGRDGLVKAEADQPDAILLDLMMPEMDGRMTFQALQANPATAAIPVILLTGDLQSIDLTDDMIAVKGMIVKPFDPLTLAQRISALLGWEL